MTIQRFAASQLGVQSAISPAEGAAAGATIGLQTY